MVWHFALVRCYYTLRVCVCVCLCLSWAFGRGAAMLLPPESHRTRLWCASLVHGMVYVYIVSVCLGNVHDMRRVPYTERWYPSHPTHTNTHTPEHHTTAPTPKHRDDALRVGASSPVFLSICSMLVPLLLSFVAVVVVDGDVVGVFFLLLGRLRG